MNIGKKIKDDARHRQEQWEAFISRFTDDQISTSQQLGGAIRIDGEFYLDFGGHIGKQVTDVPDRYLIWLSKQNVTYRVASFLAAKELGRRTARVVTIDSMPHLNFGKHRGKSVREVPSAYLSWMLRELEPEDGYCQLLEVVEQEIERRRHPDSLKICTRCGRTKPQKDFGEVPQNVDGRSGKCRNCVAEYQRQFQAKKRTDMRGF